MCKKYNSTNDVPKENKRRYVRVTKAVSASTGVTHTNGMVKQWHC